MYYGRKSAVEKTSEKDEFLVWRGKDKGATDSGTD